MSKIHQTFYCDFQFIQKVVGKGDLFNQLDLFLRSVVLNSHIKFILNIQKNQLKRIYEKGFQDLKPFEKLISDLLNNCTQRNIKNIENIESLKGLIEDSNFNIVIFGETNIEELLSYGIIAINSSMLTFEFLRNLSTPSGIYLEKEEATSWDKIFPLDIKQCNSLIIIDQYIFYEKEKLEHNIKAILKTIISNKLNIEFHIAIFCNFHPKIDSKIEDIENNFKDVIEILKGKNISITLYDSKNKFHDRYVITNNHFIDSGAGFVILKNNQEPQNSTIIRSCYPFFISNSNNFQCTAYRHILSELAKIKQNNTNFPIKEKMHYEFFGNEMEKAPHRLIDQFSKTQ